MISATAFLVSANLRRQRSAATMVSRDSRTVVLEILEQSSRIAEIVSVQSGTATAAWLMGVIMSSRGARPIGTVIGTVTATIPGTATVAGSLTAHGSSSISDSFRGTDIPTITTATITTPLITLIRIRTAMIPAFTKAPTRIIMIRAITILPIRTRTRPLPPPRSS